MLWYRSQAAASGIPATVCHLVRHAFGRESTYRSLPGRVVACRSYPDPIVD
ncbi:hypothetical protein WEI85_33895 [Actinomycetes bacterium KLBMP 9797]